MLCEFGFHSPKQQHEQRHKNKHRCNKKRRKRKVNNRDKTLTQTNIETKEDVESNKNNNSTDHGKGDQMVNIDENETLKILSKNPRGFCFEDEKDDKITAGIEYFQDAQAGAILAQEKTHRLEEAQNTGKITEQII